ncbi:MAG: TolC family protein [Candidatus Marinimicrobia bacterium]|nr:TolC family protein [Candidatus Neomarinimicrobiota bacterium]
MKFFIKLLFLLSFSFTLAQEKPTVVLDLDGFLERVKENSTDLKLVAKELETAEANKKEAYSTALPKIFSQGGYTRNLTDYFSFMDFDIPPIQLGEDMTPLTFPEKFKVNYHNQFEFNTSLQQTLFSAQVGNAITASKQYARMTEKYYDAGFLQIMVGAKKLFYQSLLLKKVFEVNQKSEANARENYKMTQNRFEAGTVSELALYQAEVNWRNTIPNVTQARKNFELALNNIKEMAGIDLNEVIELAGEFENPPAMPDFPDLENILELRPDYNALKWQSKLLKTNINAQKSGFFPSLAGNITYAYSSMSDDFKLERENNLWMIGLNLSIPIWTGGYTGAQVQKAQINYDKSQIELVKKEDAIAKELENIKLKLAEAEMRIASAGSTLKTAEKGYSIARTSAENGLATQLELKDARLLFNQAELGYYAAVCDYLVAYFDYELAIGKMIE